MSETHNQTPAAAPEPAAQPAVELAPQDDFAKALAWARQHQREIALGVAIIILGAAAISLARYFSQAGEEQAWTATLVAMRNADRDDKKLLTELTKVRQEHGGAQAMFYATMLQASLEYSQGDFAAAAKTAQRFLNDYSGNFFAPQMRLLLAQALIRQSKYDEATAELNRALKVGRSYLEPEIRLALAECLDRQGKFEAARDAYLNVSQQGRDNNWPSVIVNAASFSLMLVEDKLAGVDNTPQTPLEAAEAAKKLSGAAKAAKAPTPTTAEEKPAESKAPEAAKPAEK